jgi:hypothetical protein
MMPAAGPDQSHGMREKRTVVVVNIQISGFIVLLQAAAKLVCASTGNC